MKHYEAYRDVVDPLPRFIDEVSDAAPMQSGLGYVSPAGRAAQHARQAA